MRTVLHIGMPKTGSTALQETFLASRAHLARRGVLYPHNPPGCPFNNHRMFNFGFTEFEKLPRAMLNRKDYDRSNFRQKHDEFIAGIFSQIRKTNPECLLISSETLFRSLGLKAPRSLLEQLGPATDRFSVCAYLRRPSSHYLSGLQQRLKFSYKIGSLNSPPTYGVLQDYAKVFGKDSVSARVYDASFLNNGDIIDDFLGNHLGEFKIDRKKLKTPSITNTTVSAEAMDILRRYRLAFHANDDNVPTKDSAELVRALRDADRAVGARKPSLRPGIADLIDYSKADPLLVRDAYGIVFPGLDYGRFEPLKPVKPEAGPAREELRLSDIVLMDEAVERDIIHQVYRSGWARADPARQLWADALLRDPLF